MGFLVMLIAACATTTPESADIEYRAQARWDTLLSGDLNGAYQYLSPGYRSSVASDEYQRAVLTQKVRWTKAKYIKSDCLTNTCKVEILLDYSLVSPFQGVRKFNGQQTIIENWVKVNAQWWYVPKS